MKIVCIESPLTKHLLDAIGDASDTRMHVTPAHIDRELQHKLLVYNMHAHIILIYAL
jgi:hypothetical protein